jgi:hypothetical protein
LLEAALDATAKQSGRTGTIWEFYHPLGCEPESLQSKPDTEFNTPFQDYLAITRCWQWRGFMNRQNLNLIVIPLIDQTLNDRTRIDRVAVIDAQER